jgi:hypothetical protein
MLRIYSEIMKSSEIISSRSMNYESEAEGRIEIRLLRLSVPTCGRHDVRAPPGRIELANCFQEEMKPPHVDFSPDRTFRWAT